jgi:hypothetical protein
MGSFSAIKTEFLAVLSRVKIHAQVDLHPVLELVCGTTYSLGHAKYSVNVCGDEG